VLCLSGAVFFCVVSVIMDNSGDCGEFEAEECFSEQQKCAWNDDLNICFTIPTEKQDCNICAINYFNSGGCDNIDIAYGKGCQSCQKNMVETCSKKSCNGTDLTITNSIPNSCGTKKFGEDCKFDCVSDYTPSGAVTCLNNGKWSTQTCQANEQKISV
jgi:hypothetical protein